MGRMYKLLSNYDYLKYCNIANVQLGQQNVIFNSLAQAFMGSDADYSNQNQVCNAAVFISLTKYFLINFIYEHY